MVKNSASLKTGTVIHVPCSLHPVKQNVKLGHLAETLTTENSACVVSLSKCWKFWLLLSFNIWHIMLLFYVDIHTHTSLVQQKSSVIFESLCS